MVGGHVIELGGSLIVPGAPGTAAVERDDRSLIGHHEHDVRLQRVDPEPLVVVTAGRSAKAPPGDAAIRALPRHHVHGVHRVRIAWVHGDGRKVVAPPEDPAVGRGTRPAGTRIVAPIEAALGPRGGRHEDPAGVARTDADAKASQAISCGRDSTGELRPGRAAIGALEEPRVGTAPRGILPWALPRFPEHGVHRIGIIGRQHHVGGAGVLVLEEHPLERLPPIGGAVDATLGIGSVRMPQHRHENAVRVRGIDGDARDLLAVAEPQMGPAPATIAAPVEPVPRGEIGALQPFATPHVEDLRIRRGHFDRPDGAGRLLVEDGLPGAPGIGGLPDAAIGRGDEEGMRPGRDPHGALGAPGPERADVPPPEPLNGRGRDGRLGRQRRRHAPQQGSPQQGAARQPSGHAPCGLTRGPAFSPCRHRGQRGRGSASQAPCSPHSPAAPPKRPRGIRRRGSPTRRPATR